MRRRLALVDAPAWPNGKLVVVGPAGSGKTHLGRIWAADAGADVVTGADLAQADIPALAAAGAVFVDDAGAVAGRAEEALFHLHNLLGAQGGRLLLAARARPADWGLGLPDLKSRMEATTLVRLEAPDDALLAAILVKSFADRQVAVDPTLIAWLVPRIDRSASAATAIAARLDRAALGRGGRISRALAAEVLDGAAPGDDIPGRDARDGDG